MGKIYVVPREGLMVPDKDVLGGSDAVRLPPEGKEVEESTYWIRRRDDGDVTFGRPESAAAAKKGGSL